MPRFVLAPNHINTSVQQQTHHSMLLTQFMLITGTMVVTQQLEHLVLVSTPQFGTCLDFKISLPLKTSMFILQTLIIGIGLNQLINHTHQTVTSILTLIVLIMIMISHFLKFHPQQVVVIYSNWNHLVLVKLTQTVQPPINHF